MESSRKTRGFGFVLSSECSWISRRHAGHAGRATTAWIRRPLAALPDCCANKLMASCGFCSLFDVCADRLRAVPYALLVGPAEEKEAQPGGESLPLRIAIVGLIVVLLVGGLWPNALLALAGGVQ